ncbi:RNA polymerase sigma factor [Egibacter rhizosphaerae]|nr:sigma-70 family RNA polymerase sigma factor [Egibacter rhizosphaerae]
MSDHSEALRRFERAFDEHYDAVFTYACRRSDRETAADVAAETFTVAWRRLDNVRAGEERPWLFSIAWRVLQQQRRARDREPPAEVHDRADDRAEAGDRVVERDDARRALAQLNERDRELLMLVAWEGLDLAEAAAALGFSRATTRVRLHRARRRLAQLMAPTGSPPGDAPGSVRFVQSGEQS